VLALLAITAVLAITAWLVGWHRIELVIAIESAGAAALLAAMVVLYRQVRIRQAATRELHNVEARVSDVVESAMDPIITVDESQRVVLFNEASERVFGLPRAAVLGQPLDKLLPERYREAHQRHIEQFGKTGSTSRRMGSQMVLMALRADGHEFPIEASISKHREDGRQRFTVILRDITDRVRQEGELRRSKEELRELSVALHQAREQEKSRIARELHDELGQALTSLQMDIAWCKQRIPQDGNGFAGKLQKMETMLERTVAATRRIATELRPLMLDDLGLVPAVEWLVESFTQRSGVVCELAVSHENLDLPAAHATAVFRTVQEALTNVAKHARASRVDVAIWQADGRVSLSVHDDGVGFSTEDSRKPNSFGLLGLRERAALLGGEARISSAQGKGTHIELRLPSGEGPLKS
jgi:PAS domain S-box-containing protein